MNESENTHKIDVCSGPSESAMIQWELFFTLDFAYIALPVAPYLSLSLSRFFDQLSITLQPLPILPSIPYPFSHSMFTTNSTSSPISNTLPSNQRLSSKNNATHSEALIILLYPRRNFRLLRIQRRAGGTLKEIHFKMRFELVEIALPSLQMLRPFLRVFGERNARIEQLNAAHFDTLQPTGNDTIEERKIIRDIHCNPMHRDPTRDVDSDGSDLVSIHVHSRLSLDAFSMNVKLGKTVNNGLF